MTPVKKLEIIVDYVEFPHILKLLEKNGFDSYSVIRDVSGRGNRGIRAGDGLSGEFNNSYIMIACTPEEADRIVALIRPVLKTYGGVCLVSDAMWVRH